MIQPQPCLIDLNPNGYSQEFHYHPFLVKLDRCVGSCNTLNDLCNKNQIQNVIQINGGITLNVDVSVKSIIYVKMIIFAILLYVIVKMENI